ncbi:MAG: YciI family protein, partial [Actinomycetota bacterium]
MAKYLLGIYSNEGQWAQFSQEEVAQAMKAWNAFTDETKASGAFIAAEAQAPTATARTVSMSGTKKSTTDGP